ncbi:hypothetical protein EAX61_14040 [Dokdonia sinensis]|uniref:Uncharacterized protein n=1 Tax=Dokdonia sinensis TaxID=2479847 RepID=A0A3M0FVJ6_9FLAO|nr:hypothetical protein EAX61_14040 [Dokdonia sinensis]
MFITTSCVAQKATIQEFDQNKRDALRVFLNNQKSYTFVDENVIKVTGIKKFVGRYRKARSLYRTADKICGTSKDTYELKFYCPIKDSFSIYENLLNEDDLFYILNNFDKFHLTLPSKLPLDTLWGENVQSLKKHSEQFYNALDYNRYDGNPNIDEYPSLRIYGCLLNENKTVAIIPYNHVHMGVNHGRVNFFLLKKMDGIWWKPIGPLKI